ncbi:unnamed protein product [Porites lobata]|uniref:Uncharacterized protein n=1 Tax=Porites lobata TaxID=104759 RepID=A0ABN8N5H4_9CNID|nr:unnamed protein product [Porites lobata]
MNLVGALEFRCFREHEDYAALSSRTVLLQVAPLLRNKDGRSYRRRSGIPENEFIRAVAYRCMIRWLCGYMGWENTRPLPACIYHDIRSRLYQTLQSRGYRNALPE